MPAMPTHIDNMRPPVQSGKAEEDYIHYSAIPVFREHVRDDQVIDKDRLSRIAEKMNQRISATGDWVPVVVGHNPKDGDGPSPKVVGFAGPFRIKDNYAKSTDEYGNVRYESGIVADFWIYRDQPDVMRENPRRSVEFWPGEDIFDPIALLGSKTPHLDLGIAYHREGVESVTYEMDGGGDTGGAEPSVATGSNTSIPDGLGKKKKLDYSDEPYGGLDGIISVIRPLVRQMIDEALNVAEPRQGEAEEMPEVATPAAGADPTIEKASEATVNTPADSLDESNDFRKMYMKAKVKQYACEDGETAYEKVSHFAKSLDNDEDRAALDAVLADEAAAEEDKEFYEKCVAYMKGTGAEEGEDPPVDDYQKRAEENRVKYERARDERAETAIKYERVTKERDELRQELAKRDTAIRYERRRNTIDKLAQTHVMEPDQEFEFCKDLTDDQFDQVVNRIATNYQKATNPGIAQYAARTEPITDEDKAREAHVGLTRKICDRYMETKGRSINYDKARDLVKNRNGQIDIEEAVRILAS